MTESTPNQQSAPRQIGTHSLCERLKSETRVQHEAIEGTLTILMSPELTLARYTEVVERFHGFFADWEPRAERVLQEEGLGALLVDRRKTGQLAADLIALGYDAGSVDRLPRCKEDDSVPSETLADVLGTMYVTEGSTLGGQIIAGHLERRLNLSGGHGYSYFRGAGRETMPRWRAFKTILDTALPPEAEAAAIASAARTFTTLQAWMSGGRAG